MNTKIVIIAVLVFTAGWLMWNYWINNNTEKKNNQLENQKSAGAEVISRQWAVGSSESRMDDRWVVETVSENVESGRDGMFAESSNGYEVLGDLPTAVQNDRVEATECSETITMANVDRGVDYKKSVTNYYLSTSGCGCSDIKDVSENIYNKFITEHPTGIATGNVIKNYAN